MRKHSTVADISLLDGFGSDWHVLVSSALGANI